MVKLCGCWFHVPRLRVVDPIVKPFWNRWRQWFLWISTTVLNRESHDLIKDTDSTIEHWIRSNGTALLRIAIQRTEERSTRVDWGLIKPKRTFHWFCSQYKIDTIIINSLTWFCENWTNCPAKIRENWWAPLCPIWNVVCSTDILAIGWVCINEDFPRTRCGAIGISFELEWRRHLAVAWRARNSPDWRYPMEKDFIPSRDFGSRVGGVSFALRGDHARGNCPTDEHQSPDGETLSRTLAYEIESQ